MPPRNRARSRFYDHCQVCGKISPHVNRHMLRAHLPWYLDPATSCADCHMSAGRESDRQRLHGRHLLFGGEYLLQAWFLLMNGFFLFPSQQLGLGSPIELLGCAALRGLVPALVVFSDEEYFFLREYDQRAGFEPLTLDGYMAVPPTRLITLIHPNLMTRLITHLDVEAMSRLKTYTKYCLVNGSSPPSGYPTVKMGIVDAHFHLDSFSSHQHRSLSELERSKSIPIRIPFAIANYVFPNRWRLLTDQVRADPRVGITLGAHPHMITLNGVNSIYGRMKSLIDRNPEAVGIGEVGLDLTTKCKHGCFDRRLCREQKLEGQRTFLRLAFQLAKAENKVLVLHVRDKGTGEAAKEVLNVVKEMNMQQHPIHRHCFVGKEDEYSQWYTSLPNCYFSISPVTANDPVTMSALRTQAFHKRILLESDANYIDEFPWVVNNVASRVAWSLGMSMTELVWECNKMLPGCIACVGNLTRIMQIHCYTPFCICRHSRRIHIFRSRVGRTNHLQSSLRYAH